MQDNLNPSPDIDTTDTDTQNNLLSEKIIDAKSGCGMMCLHFTIFFIGIGGGVGCIVAGAGDKHYSYLIAIGVILIILTIGTSIFLCTGYFTNGVNEAHILTLFGKYYGTVKKNGFLWINPFTSKTFISLKARNLNGKVIKVNDKHGNPVMMGCVVVWKVYDTAKAHFEVINVDSYINVQSEGVVREIGCLFPYDKLTEEDTITLKGDQTEINKILIDLLTKRCMPAGIEIMEAKITELSYANEIAEVMLKTQAADAVIAARDKIVNGAVSIIGHALNSLSHNEICNMSRERKAKLVTNMLVVLCGESQNTATSASPPGLIEGANKYRI